MFKKPYVEKNKNLLLSLAYYLILLWLLHNQYVVAGFAWLYIPFFVFFIKNWQFLFTTVTCFIGTLFFTSGVYFICRILAEKAINGEFGIDANFINYSASVYGFMLAIPISMMLISTLCICLFFTRDICYQIISYFSDKYGEKQATLNYHFTLPVILGFMLLSIPMTYINSQFEDHYPLLDAYHYSNCNSGQETKKDLLYIRKDSSYYLQIQWRGFFIPPSYTLVGSRSL